VMRSRASARYTSVGGETHGTANDLAGPQAPMGRASTGDPGGRCRLG
jgi:hypothetical protein